MKIAIVILFLIFGAAAVVAIVLYSSYEKPIQEASVQYNNLTLMAFDEISKMPVETGYDVYLGGFSTLLAEGKTLKDGRVLVQLRVNQSFTVFSQNRGNQSFYTTNITIFPQPGSNSIKLDLPLTPEGNLNLSHRGNLEDGTGINLVINASGTVKNIGACVRWSTNIISVKNDFYREMLIPKRLKNKIDKCYSITPELKNAILVVPFRYDVFGTISPNDFINVTIIDGDVSPTMPSTTIAFENQDGSDVGIQDISYIIRPFNNNNL